MIIATEIANSNFPLIFLSTFPRLSLDCSDFSFLIFSYREKIVHDRFHSKFWKIKFHSKIKCFLLFSRSNFQIWPTGTKFRNVITADRLFARATMLKYYESNIKGNKYSVFLPKFLNKEDRERERNLFKKRRELLESRNEIKDIKIWNKILYLKNQAVNCTEWLPNKIWELGALWYNVRSLLKLERRQTFSNSIILKNFDIICLSETWLKNEIRNSEVFLGNYKCFLSNRRSSLQSTSHGGILIGVKSGVRSEPVNFSFNNNGAAVACYIKLD